MTAEELICKLKNQVTDEICDSDTYFDYARTARLLGNCKVANLLDIIADEEMCHSRMVVRCLRLMGVIYDGSNTKTEPKVTMTMK